MKKKSAMPISIRPSPEDVDILHYLCDRLGLKIPQVIRLAIRRLNEQEIATSRPSEVVAKPARKTR